MRYIIWKSGKEVDCLTILLENNIAYSPYVDSVTGDMKFETMSGKELDIKWLDANQKRVSLDELPVNNRNCICMALKTLIGAQLE